MLNKEKYAKEIMDVAISGKSLAVRRATNEICSCEEISCRNCMFNTNGSMPSTTDCTENCKTWCNSKYIPKQGVAVTINIMSSPDKINMTEIEEALINAGYDLISSDFIEIPEDTMDILMKSYVPPYKKED